MEPKRFIIDGTVGAGKTTILTGFSSVDKNNTKFPCLADYGFNILGGVNRKTIAILKLLRKKPFKHLDEFLDISIEIAIEEFKKAKEGHINFYDRGLPYQKLLAENHNYKIPNIYYTYCETYRYNSPIFILNPILTIDMSKPLLGEEPEKIYPIEKRLKQHDDVIKLYKQFGYEVIVVPEFSTEINTNILMRLDFILNHLKQYEKNAILGNHRS